MGNQQKHKKNLVHLQIGNNADKKCSVPRFDCSNNNAKQCKAIFALSNHLDSKGQVSMSILI